MTHFRAALRKGHAARSPATRPEGAMKEPAVSARAGRAIRLVCAALLTALSAISAPPLAQPITGQEVQQTAPRLRVFLDCHVGGCDFDYFRREIDFVDWVRDREDSDVHLLVTSERTGGGGQSLDLAFLGRAGFAARGDTLTHTYLGTDTQDERRSGLAEAIRAGLVPYMADAGQLTRIEIRSRAGDDSSAGAGGARGGPAGDDAQLVTDDPWDFWVFRVGLNGSLNGQSTTSSNNLSSNLSASRTTDLWKLSFVGFGGYNERTFELTDGEQTFITRNLYASGSVVRSLTDHWSTGAQGTLFHNTQSNQDLTLRFAPAIEYNVYPYSESSRRQLVLQYSLGVNSFDYTEETLYSKTSEVLYDHTMAAAIEQTQPWGSIEANVTASQYLNRTSKYSVSLSGGANLRLTRGLSLRVSGSYSWIRNQLHLPGSELEDDEILLRLRDLQTSFRYRTSIGFSYQFGSIFNNVVNPRLRFRGRGGGGFFFF